MLLTPAWNRLLLEWPPTDVFCSAEVSVHHWRRTCCHAAAAAVLCLLLYHNDIIHKFIIKIICGALHEYIMTATGANAERQILWTSIAKICRSALCVTCVFMLAATYYIDREAVQSERSTLLNWSCGEKSCDFLTIRGPHAPFFLPFVASVCNMSFHIRSEVPLVLFVNILCNLCVHYARNLLLLTCIIPLIACHCDMC